MTKFTPGPWSVYPGQNPGIEGDGGTKIAEYLVAQKII